MNFFEFCERLRQDGAYIGEDWHVYRADGRPLSRKCRNGYYLVRKMYNNQYYHFCEHRVIWYWWNGPFDQTLTINHKDFDRTNNNISNLELMTQKENTQYTVAAGRNNAPAGEVNGKALFTDNEVRVIRYLHENGWDKNSLRSMFGIKWSATLDRILKGARYGNVTPASDIIQIYPAIVERTWHSVLQKKDRITNAIMGLNGEIGELTDLYKKVFYHGHDADAIHIMLELGDIMYYLCALCNEIGVDFSEICYENMEKLKARYPDGFKTENSLNRKEGDI